MVIRYYRSSMATASMAWQGDDENKPAPEPLSRLQELVNTREIDTGRDRLADPADAGPWLAARGLLPSSAALDADELALVRGVREALRAMLIHNAGGPTPDPAALRPLRVVAELTGARVALDVDGAVRLGRDGDGLHARLLEILLAVRDAQRDGTWARLKACRNDECRWAFYDRSRNHGGAWCDMAACGNRLKNRDFRARKRQRRH
jgi:predicted RNA-binding Zn ribbon-like protein